MSGRAYTMKEMKSIVDYVNKRKAYGEIKGRKFWTDFACSNLTTRTWQSLKETFLKRILPDIHNPYYGLTKSEICSFKQGYDIDSRNTSKLEFQTISDESNHSNAGIPENEKPSTSTYNDAEKSAGENISPSTLDARTRASTETIILDNCYENAEDIQRDLESPKSNKPKESGSKDEKETPSKCLRDLITYAEPFTPMMQQVLDDFATEDELVEADLEILESTNNITKKNQNKGNSELDNGSVVTNKKNEVSTEKLEEKVAEIVQSDSVKIPLGQESKISDDTSVRNSSDAVENSNDNGKTIKEKQVSYSLDKREKNKNFIDLTHDTAHTQNTNNSTDSTIPGNQEALKNKTQPDPPKANDTTKDVFRKLTLSRNRSNSLDLKSNEKKEMLVLKNKNATQSETEDKSEKTIAENKQEKNEISKLTSNDFQKLLINKEEESRQEIASQVNPCLNSVSLYEEQFNNVKYTDSDSSDDFNNDSVLQVRKETEITNTDKNGTEKVTEDKNEVEKKADYINETEKAPPAVLKNSADINEIVILKSHSETEESNEDENKDNHGKVKPVDKKEINKALASVFGFSSGVVSSSRKRKLSRHHRSPSYKHNASNSSEWTSESDSDFVSPPRGRRNRYARKYLKPKSARLMQLEEDGGLFVMHGKRIYPLVKDGNLVKNYLTYSVEGETEDDPAYWKKKYKDEKKKTEELKKMIEEVQVRLPLPDQSPAVATTSRQSSLPQSPPKLIPITEKPKVSETEEKPKQEKSHDKPLKIKFIKNNEEVQLEGSWSQIHPVLADVVQIFNKEAEPIKEAELAIKTNGRADSGDSLSVRSSPLDEEAVRKKVEKMEEEIFKEIEELDKSEREQEEANAKVTAVEVNDQEDNINKRRRIGGARKSSTAMKSADSSSSPSRPKRTKAAKDTEIDHLVVPKEALPKRRTRSPKKITKEDTTAAVEKTKADNKPARTSRKSKNTEPESTRLSLDDDSVRYMFPPAKKTRKSAGKITTTRSLNPTNPTCENLMLNSIESSQGYQDSDPSPTRERIMLKRKRKLSLSNILYRGKQRRFVRRKSYPCVSDDASSESSNLSFKKPLKNTSASLQSDVYRSESYQLLMPVKKQYCNALEKIDELHPTHNFDKDALKLQVDGFDLNDASGSSGPVRSDGNSSNVSLPQSPELSIVENISVCKELLESIEDFPTINEIQANNQPNSVIHNKFLMSAVDVTMPLMGQNCDIQQSNTPDYLDYQNDPPTNGSLSNQINSVNITEGPTISDSLDSRLRNLLLESAKKMEVDTVVTITEDHNSVAKNSAGNVKKPKAKKRCSTPHKRNSKKKLKIPDIETVVEEERMEFCSYGGRKSCPPTLQVLPDDIHNGNETSEKNKEETVKRGRKKKDVIKVKILKPINKQQKVSPAKEFSKTYDVSTISVHTDSGINETGSILFLQDTDDSVDLIHNHSETCLQTKECVGDSIEFIEQDTSVISVNSQDIMEFRDAENIPPEGFSNNAHDGTDITRAKIISSQSTGETVYHSPLASDLSLASLITEDLSDEEANENAKPRGARKWYLFSDDETTNTNGFGANLMQIFPLTCAVPDLSTITEMSKENDSRKPTLDTDGDTRNDCFDSDNVF